MSKGIIAVDVDLTVCAIDELWLEWLCNVTNSRYATAMDVINYQISNNMSVPYNLSEMFKYGLDKHGIDGLDFFRGSGIYDFAYPVGGAVGALKYLKESGYEIVFVSVCKGFHYKSKYYWLKRHFPFMDGFIATKEKQYTRCDIIIDDRISHLNSMPDGVHCIRYMTPYTQDELPENKIKACKTWNEIVEYINKSEKGEEHG